MTDEIDEFIRNLIYIIQNNNRTPKKLTAGMRVGNCILVTDQIPPREYFRKSGTEYHKQWDLQCDCGKHTIRTEYYLNRALKKGIEVSCYDCFREIRGIYGSRYVSTKQIKTRKIVNNFPNREELYYSEVVYMEEGNSFFDPPSVVFDHPIRNHTFEKSESSRGGGGALDKDEENPSCKQQNQWLFEITGEGGWECDNCCAIFPKGFGCVRCLHHICPVCKNSELHTCPRTWRKTWENEVKDNGLLQRRLDKLQEKQLALVTAEEKERFEKGWLHRKKQREEAEKKEAIKELNMARKAKEKKRFEEKKKERSEQIKRMRARTQRRKDRAKKAELEEQKIESSKQEQKSRFELYGGYEWDENRRLYIKVKI